MSKLYSVGVGAGDGAYITLGAIHALENADIIAAPVKKAGEKSTALEIVRREFDADKMEILELEFPMSGDTETRRAARKAAAEKIIAALADGKTVAMVTLGDVSVYSTCTYVHKAVTDAGYEVEIVPGVTSFCAAADKAGISLCEGNESMAIIPSAADLDKCLDNFDTVVIMKAGKDIDVICDILERRRLAGIAAANIGMENEEIAPLKRGREYGYFTTVIVKKCPR